MKTHYRIRQRALVVTAVCVSLLLSAGSSHGANERREPPSKMLWAWHRAEDLRFIDPAEYGVAYLACSVLLHKDEVKTFWRQQPLKVPQETYTMPVVRVDVDFKNAPTLSQKMVLDLTSTVMRAAQQNKSEVIQIDFDARLTERAFYRELLESLRRSSKDSLKVSITALASWCLFDNWMSNLPVFEKIPMMFSLGAERSKVVNYFRSGGEFLNTDCCHSLGVSLEDEEVAKLMIPRIKPRKMPVRVYFFTRTAWTREKYEKVRSLQGNQ